MKIQKQSAPVVTYKTSSMKAPPPHKKKQYMFDAVAFHHHRQSFILFRMQIDRHHYHERISPTWQRIPCNNNQDKNLTVNLQLGKSTIQRMIWHRSLELFNDTASIYNYIIKRKNPEYHMTFCGSQNGAFAFARIEEQHLINNQIKTFTRGCFKLQKKTSPVSPNTTKSEL